MSDLNGPRPPRESGTDLHDDKSGVETVKDEGAAVTDTAVDAAKDVGQRTKDEAASVVNDAKDELQNLYQQTRSELTDEAAKQQDRVATGLQAIGDDLNAMAAHSEENGLARELVRNTSQRVGDAATWLSAREPGDVLHEVKSFARRQPGVFIGAAAIAGVVAGRLTRALAASAKDDQERGTAGSAPAGRSTDTPPLPSEDPLGAPSGADVPASPLVGGIGRPVNDMPVAPQPGSSPSVSGEDGSNERPYTL